METVYTVTVLNWDRWNPKRAQKEYSWLRLQVDALTCQDLFGLSAEMRLVWVYLLCQAAKKNGDPFRLDAGYLKEQIKVLPKTVIAALEIFAKRGMINHDAVSLPPHYDVTTPLDGRTDGRTDETNERDERTDNAQAHPSFDFESVYKIYPRKLGKQKGLAICKRDIKTPEQFSSLLTAIDRYTKHCRKEGVDPKFIKHFSTFMGSWKDWLDPDVGTLNAPKQALRPEHVVHIATPESQERPLADHRLRSREVKLAIARAGVPGAEKEGA